MAKYAMSADVTGFAITVFWHVTLLEGKTRGLHTFSHICTELDQLPVEHCMDSITTANAKRKTSIVNVLCPAGVTSQHHTRRAHCNPHWR